DFAQGLLAEAARDRAAAPDYTWVEMVSSRSEHELDVKPMATILGFADLLGRDTPHIESADQQLVLQMMNEERYFVVLMAYDLRTKQDGKPLERIWVARLSMPSRRTNFTEALDKLGTVGSRYFGENQPNLLLD